MSERVLMDLKFGPKVVYEGHSPDNKAWEEHNKVLRYPLSYIASKYGKNHGWSVVTSQWDLEKKGINFTIICEQNNTKDVYASYEDICKDFNWKSFTFDEKVIAVLPEIMTLEEIEEALKPALERTALKDKKRPKPAEQQKEEDLPDDVPSEEGEDEDLAEDEETQEPSFSIEGL